MGTDPDGAGKKICRLVARFLAVLWKEQFAISIRTRFLPGRLTGWTWVSGTWGKEGERRNHCASYMRDNFHFRKGIPSLLDAWEKAALRDAELELVGRWQLAESKRASLPSGVKCQPPCSPQALRYRYRAADIFVFSSFFEGFGLVLLEAMACGLPAIASEATGGPDIMTESCGRLVQTGNLEALVESLRWFDKNREKLPAMSRAARAQAESYSWENYRRRVAEAVAPFV
jgi:glycosyltransferase involved in cell wall biosynthesis